MVLMLKRWRIVKYSKITGNLLPTSAPEATRRFWTRAGAVVEADRLGTVAHRHSMPYRYEVEKR